MSAHHCRNGRSSYRSGRAVITDQKISVVKENIRLDLQRFFSEKFKISKSSVDVTFVVDCSKYCSIRSVTARMYSVLFSEKPVVNHNT